MTIIYPDPARYNPPLEVYRYFDKLKFRMSADNRPTRELLQYLRKHCVKVGRVRKGHHIAGSNLVCSFRLVAPDADALRAISNQPWLVNEAEAAENTILPDDACAESLHELHDHHFVQPWHGRHETRRFVSKAGHVTSYSGQRRNGLRYGWYSDRPCKLTGELSCFHLEARFMGAEAVRRLGIHSPADLLRFDHDEFWLEHHRLEAVDLERLGRWHLNRLEGRRRHKPRISKHGRLVYNHDLRTGGLLVRINGRHPRQGFPSVQWLIDRIGRGPFLVRLHVPALDTCQRMQIVG